MTTMPLAKLLPGAHNSQQELTFLSEPDASTRDKHFESVRRYFLVRKRIPR
jgi:hypothetical protein